MTLIVDVSGQLWVIGGHTLDQTRAVETSTQRRSILSAASTDQSISDHVVSRTIINPATVQ